MTARFLKIALLLVLLCGVWTAGARAAETPPDLYRSSPIIPYAKKIGEHRFRSPRTYDDTLTYYRKIFVGDPKVAFEKIVNTSRIRGMHLKNKVVGGRWEGLNIYEHNGQTVIFVVFSDKELEAIAAEQAKRTSPKKSPAPKKGGS